MLQDFQRAAYIVDYNLRKKFPKDYNIRCLYSSEGIKFLMAKMGHVLTTMAGEARVLAVPKGIAPYEINYFTTEGHRFGHYWCVSDNFTLDLSTSYIAEKNTNYHAGPVMFWPRSEKQCPGVEHRAQFKVEHVFNTDINPEIKSSMDDFIRMCEVGFDSAKNYDRFNRTILTGWDSLPVAEEAGCPWVKGMKIFISNNRW